MSRHAHEEHDPTSITARGFAGGQATFDGRFVEISKRGIAAAAGGGGSKRIPVRAISAIQLKPATWLTNGYIQFTMPGGNEVRAQFGRQSFDAAGDENSVIFTRKQMAQFVQLRTAIEDVLAEGAWSA